MTAQRILLAAALVCAVFLARAETPARVVSVGGAVSEIVVALGAQDRLVAVDATSVYPPDLQSLPQVGYMRSLSAEGLLSQRPRVVLATADAGPAATLAQVRAAGVNVATVPSEHSFAAVQTKVRVVAAALGLEAEGAALEQRLAQEWCDTARVVAAQHTRPRVLFILAHAGNTLLVAGQDTAAHAMIELAGAQNVAGGFQGYKPLTAEAAIGAAPDVILITNEGIAAIGGADKLWDRPGLGLTPAAKSRRVVALDALYLLGFGPRMPQAVRELATRLRQG